MITLLAFVGAIALLVVFHELGHYWVARRCGVKVLRFSFGFGKMLYSRRVNGTEWAISAIPLGGYVKMLDERESEVAPEELDQAFNRKPVLQRMAIVVSGPLSNFLLAIFLYWVLFVHGIPGLKPVLGEVPPGTPAAMAQMQPGETITHIDGEPVPSWQEVRWTLLDYALQQAEVKIEGRSAQGELLTHVLDMRGLEANELDGELLARLGLQLRQPLILPVIGKLTEGGVAQQAGLQPGDVVLSANGRAMQRWSELVEVVRAHPGQAVQLDIRRGDVGLSLSVVPQAVDEGGKPVGKIGAAPQLDKAEREAMLTEVSYGPVDAFGQALRKTWETSVVSLKMLGKMVLGEVSMKNLSGPIIPLLDGGHLLYYAAELAKGSPVSERAWELGQKIGIALLGTLMVFAIYNDITRLISG